MQNNRAFWRALHSLTHPLSIAAIVLLLLNDHWLRLTAPSWLTGKLGDFAWLVFAPLITAALFAWLVPSKFPKQERVVGVMAFVFIGLWFALAKTVPAVHHLTLQTAEAINGWQGSLRMDATDLLMLPALLIGWWVWERAGNQAVSLRPIAYVALALGVFGTLANSFPIPDFGVTCLTQQGSDLWAMTGTGPFKSDDGGLSWQPEALATSPNLTSTSCLAPSTPLQVWVLPASQTQPIQYRFRQSQGIDHSGDGGQTWTQEFDLTIIGSEARRNYGRVDRNIPASWMPPVPVSAQVDLVSGNVIAAMGHDGVLVRTANGTWQWVTVGPYQYREFQPVIALFSLLLHELWLAIALIFLISTTASYHVSPRIFPYLFIVWLLWVVGVLMLTLNRFINWFFTPLSIGIICLIVAGAFALWWSAMSRVRERSHRASIGIMTIAIVGAGLFLLPYGLWLWSTIPRYESAAIFALFLALAAVISALVYADQTLKLSHAHDDDAKSHATIASE